MPFRTAKQQAYLQAHKPEVAKKFMEHGRAIKNSIKNFVRPKYEGKGTRARLNTAAEKMMFNTKYS